MTLPLQILGLYAVWFAAIYVVHRISIRSQSGSVGVPLAYLLTMTFLHIGGLIYVLPGYSHTRQDANWYLARYNFTDEMVLQGVIASTIFVVGLAIGCFLCRGRMVTSPAAPPGPRWQAPRRPGPARPPRPARSALPMILLGLAAAAFLPSALNLSLPGLQAILMAGRNLATVAICMGLWLAWSRRDKASAQFWTAMTMVIPLIYLVRFGFFSYGFVAMATFLSLWLSMPEREARRRLVKIVVMSVAIYLSFSLFVSYMEVRRALREVLWSEDADLATRAEAIIVQFSNASLLNPLDYRQMDWVNIRLNHNLFIGKAMAMHEIYPTLRENGHAILLSLIAWVPRYFWPGKPEMGGNDFVERHSGMSFSDQAALGSGPVFELFVNFGLVGVFVGAIVMGWILRWMDAYCARQLKQFDLPRFLRGFLVCTCLINPFSTVFFFVSASAASWVFGTAVIWALEVTGLGGAPARRPPAPRQRPPPALKTTPR